MEHVRLLFSRRFGPIFACMALGAFNDNFYKNALIILITYVLADSLDKDASMLISFAAACFILPFFLFSGTAGQIADRYPKDHLVRIFKTTELALCVLAGVALMVHHLSSLMVLLFLFGVQAAFFGPVKYAILPELIRKDELLAGNGLIEAGTFLCILIGTLTGGLMILRPFGVHFVALTMIAIGMLGIYASTFVPPTEAKLPALSVRWNIFASTYAMLRHAVQEPPIFYAILGISWFWAIGATYLTQISVFTRDIIGGNQEVVSLYMGLFSIGTGLGAISCQCLVRRFSNAKIAPVVLSGICMFGLDLCWVGYSLPDPGDVLFGLDHYFTTPDHFRIAFDLLMIAVCGGAFIVPLYTQLQLESSEAHRARSIASNNVFNALFTSVAALLAAGLYWLDFDVNQVLLIFAALNIPVIYYLYRRAAWAL